MRRVFIGMAVISLLLSGCGLQRQTKTPGEEDFIKLQHEQGAYGRGLNVISSIKDVKAGERSQITVQGDAGGVYEIISTYRVGEKSYTVRSTKMADREGRVSWDWIVSPDTLPGIYPITISGNGAEILSSYSVKE
ncbi:hypothetical protein DFR58_11331 [Anaerobacterium chartisolvens]|uniref:Uncharacterized protein n=1 Tax=Anaerobacterium chartisolvens TaxID=1297424 RepID=A0A369B208_9FIRM|nr:hypothetical protein [Anaerobacterium chartisolvens]RCX15451.1 hypothetical protein DFR58_11331 [Anaerobacterium chartisolvens]